MVSKFAVIGFLALLTACGGVTPAETALTGCENFQRSWSVLADLRAKGKLSGSQVKLVEDTVAVVEPFCLGPAPDVDAETKDVAVSAGLQMLQGIIVIVTD